jgi:hypothetical protein
LPRCLSQLGRPFDSLVQHNQIRTGSDRLRRLTGEANVVRAESNRTTHARVAPSSSRHATEDTCRDRQSRSARAHSSAPVRTARRRELRFLAPLRRPRGDFGTPLPQVKAQAAGSRSASAVQFRCVSVEASRWSELPRNVPGIDAPEGAEGFAIQCSPSSARHSDVTLYKVRATVKDAKYPIEDG